MSSAKDWAALLIKTNFKQQQLIGSYYKDVLRFMLSKFDSLVTLNSEDEITKVRSINATAERTVAKLYQENNIVLPLISISQDISTDDPDRIRPNFSVIPKKYWDSKRKRALRVVSYPPRAININYGINIWTKYKEDLDQVAEQVRLLFAPGLRIVTSKNNSTLAFIDREDDNSSLLLGDREDRILRKSFLISIEGYLEYPEYLITSTGQVKEFNIDLLSE
jgi:hypothetical protein